MGSLSSKLPQLPSIICVLGQVHQTKMFPQNISGLINHYSWQNNPSPLVWKNLPEKALCKNWETTSRVGSKLAIAIWQTLCQHVALVSRMLVFTLLIELVMLSLIQALNTVRYIIVPQSQTMWTNLLELNFYQKISKFVAMKDYLLRWYKSVYYYGSQWRHDTSQQPRI